MSRSKRDCSGGRINAEVIGHATTKVVGGRLIVCAGGEHVGSPAHKRWAKSYVQRQRRRDSKRVIADQVEDQAS